MNLRKARVVAVHPQWGTCDIVYLDNGVRVSDVEVMGTSSTTGCSWRIPSVPPPSSEANAGKIETAASRNLIALCATAYNRPVIMGFSRPVQGILPAQLDRWLDAHDASGSYMTFAPDGSYEVYIPGGGYLRIGTGAHEDLSTKLATGKLGSSGPAAITVTLATPKGTLTLDPLGNWTLTGASLTIDCDVTVNGNLTVTENVSAGNGASGSVPAGGGNVITLRDGIITNVY